jgi:hypothetical protein
VSGDEEVVARGNPIRPEGALLYYVRSCEEVKSYVHEFFHDGRDDW